MYAIAGAASSPQSCCCAGWQMAASSANPSALLRWWQSVKAQLLSAPSHCTQIGTGCKIGPITISTLEHGRSS